MTKPGALALALLASAIAGCGSDSTDNTFHAAPPDSGSEGGAQGDDGGGGDGSDDGNCGIACPPDAGKGSCPSAAPSQGSACGGPITCEYGTDERLLCDPQWGCTNGKWDLQSSPGNDCSDTAPCPASLAAADGTSCLPQSQRLALCKYPDGDCQCSDVTLTLKWKCTKPEAGCALPRPRVGTTCTTEGQTCHYGAVANDLPMICKGGVWVTG